MGTTLMALLAGWLTLSTTAPTETPGPADSPQFGAAAVPLSKEAAIERAETLATQGWQFWQQRKLSEAATAFEQSVALDSENANAWNGLSWARLNGGETDKAIAAFEKCVAFEPKHPAGLNGLGQAYLSLRQYDKAEKYFVEAAPAAAAAWYGLGRLYLLIGKYHDAQTWLEKVAASDPANATLQQMLAAAKAGALPDDLRKQIEPAAPAKPSESADLTATGWQQFNEGKSRTAEQSFRRALAKNPDDAAACNGLGFCLLNAGNAAEAKEYFQKCLKLQPEAAGAMNGLGRCLKEEGKTDDAIATWEAMYKKFPGPNAAATGLATTYLERKEYAKAIPYFEQLVKASLENGEFKQGLEAARTGAKQAGQSASDK
jgi:tetratricopeptide (TPR) repeat protein